MADMLRFLKGNQADLEVKVVAAQTVQPGAFYLTEDTNRLYVGKDSKTIELLNKAVQVVENVAALPASPPAIDGDFYYCKAENVFAVYDSDAKAWTQINVDSYVNSVVHTVSKTDTTVTVNTTVGDSNNHSKSDAFTISEGDNITLSSSGQNITITAIDEKTTQAGHYTPSTKAGTHTTTGTYITGVEYDSKGHIIGVVSGTQAATTNVISVAENPDGTAVITSTVDGKAANFNITGNGYTDVSVNTDNKTIVISSTDERATKAGHYDPTEDTESKLTASSNTLISAIKRDDNGHVVGIEDLGSKENITSAVANGTNVATVSFTNANYFGITKSDDFKVTGSGATTVSGNANTKTVTITSTDHSVTGVDYHYTPVADTDSALSIENKILTTVSRDAAGHVTGISGVDTQENVAIEVSQGNNPTITTKASTIFGVPKSSGFTIKGAGATTISGNADTEEVTISSTDVSVTSVATHYTPTTDDSKTLNAANGTVTAAKATTQVITGLKRDAAGHVTEVISAGIQDTHNDVQSIGFTANTTTSSLGVTITTKDGTTKADSKILKMQYGKEPTTAPLTTLGDNVYGYDLDVYTIAEVDSAIANAVGANGAVQIVGTITTESELVGKDAKTGDTYILVATTPVEINDTMCTSGDMFIAKGDTNSSTIDDWYYVPAGNDIEKHAKATNGFKLVRGVDDSAVLGEVEFTNSSATSTDFQVTPTVKYNEGTHLKTTVSYNLYWGTF